jgi:hypothetical protein
MSPSTIGNRDIRQRTFSCDCSWALCQQPSSSIGKYEINRWAITKTMDLIYHILGTWQTLGSLENKAVNNDFVP